MAMTQTPDEFGVSLGDVTERVAFRVEDLTDAELEEICRAEMAPVFDHLNAELK